MSDKVFTGPFPVMGDSGIPTSVVNMSGKRSPYTIERPKAQPAGGDISGPTSIRGQKPFEQQGPVGHPVTTLFFPNAANHADTGRNTRIVQGSSGAKGNFWGKRAEGPILK